MTESRAVVVTGASQGIGREIAAAFARRGDRLALVARSAEKLEETAALVREAGGSAVVLPCDLGVREEVEALATRVDTELGPPDVLVANSGIAGPTRRLWEIEPDEWEETFRVNVTGTYLTCRALLPAMLARGGGSVVVIGSMSGKRPLHGRTPYTSSKMALVGLVRSLAWETGPSGVRVNLISPGAVEGPRIEAVVRAQAEGRGISEQEARASFSAGSPLGRLVDAREVADAAVFLGSDAAAGITGEDLNVTTGQAMF